MTISCTGQYFDHVKCIIIVVLELNHQSKLFSTYNSNNLFWVIGHSCKKKRPVNFWCGFLRTVRKFQLVTVIHLGHKICKMQRLKYKEHINITPLKVLT